MKKQYSYQGYDLSFYLKPAETGLDYIELHKTLEQINKDSKKNLNYGIFDPNKDKNFLENFYKNSLVCVISLNGENIGFFYNLILPFQKSYINHQGLVLVYKNTGVNILQIPYLLGNALIYEQLGEGFITSISSTPSIIAQVSENFDNVWPGYNANNLIKPPTSEYRDVAQKLYEEYVCTFFPNPENFSLDIKRFTICLNTTEIGFESELHKLSRSSNLLGNLFCHYWINYDKGEDLVQVGKITNDTYLKIKQITKGV